jgi:SAM-dependent methyltransferase
MLGKIKNIYRKELFLLSVLAVITNPLYILRNGLYKTISSMASQVTGNVLDFGCGSKPYESIFKNAQSYVGIEIKDICLDKEYNKADCFYEGDVLPFSSDSFDSIVSFEVFEHVPNINKMFVELRRVLKPGGKLLFTMPFAWDEHEIPHDYVRYTKYGITKILEENGFDILTVKKTTTYFLTVCQMFIAYFHKNLGPKNIFLAILFQFFIIFPLTLLSLFFNLILPKREEYFCNVVVLCRKPK